MVIHEKHPSRWCSQTRCFIPLSLWVKVINPETYSWSCWHHWLHLQWPGWRPPCASSPAPPPGLSASAWPGSRWLFYTNRPGPARHAPAVAPEREPVGRTQPPPRLKLYHYHPITSTPCRDNTKQQLVVTFPLSCCASCTLLKAWPGSSSSVRKWMLMKTCNRAEGPQQHSSSLLITLGTVSNR